jgi:hypothetical protein
MSIRNTVKESLAGSVDPKKKEVRLPAYVRRDPRADARKLALGAIPFGMMALAAATASATPNLVLTDGNSSITINPTSELGLTTWSIDGDNILGTNSLGAPSTEWFWDRVGAGNAGTNAPVNTISTPTVSSAGNVGFITYTDPNTYQLKISYTLTGGATGSGQSTLLENVSITNEEASPSTTPVDMHFYQYQNFNLTGPGKFNNSLSITGSSDNTASETAGASSSRDSVASGIISGNSGAPNEWEAAKTSTFVTNESDSLPDVTIPTNLSDATGPVTGDVASAFQWDPVIGSSNFNFSESTTVAVPEPTAAGVLAVGAAGLLLRRRRKGTIPAVVG